MAAWCLPRNLSNDFLEALKDGRLSPERLLEMSSAERRAAFSEILGEDSAREVNAQFEAKMLLKDQQRGLVAWAQKVGGITEAARRDLLSTVSKLDRVLQPDEERAFLADLAAKRLGVTVTAEEAKEIFNLSKAAEDAKAEMVKDISNIPNRIAYGRAIMNLRDSIEEMKPQGQSFAHRLVDILNIPKSALTSVLHFSAPFVQGWGMLSTKEAWQGFGKMFQYFADEENYKNLDAFIISHPDYPLAQAGKLGLTKLGDKLSAREEGIQSTLVEQANQWLSDKTGVPNLVRASSRAFTGYLNYVRFSRFTQLLDAARNGGEDVRAGSSVVHDLARVVNNFTGRGELGPDDVYASVGPVLNTLFFSPRKIIATVEMFNPVRFLDPRISPTARIAAVRQLGGSLIATGAVLALAKAMGASVSFDPRDQNFAKIVIGGEKLDMTGGNAAYIRLLGRLATGQEISAHGKLTDLGQGYKATTRADLVVNYVRGKLSPIAGFMADALYGTDPVGHPFSVTDEMRDKLMPITMDSFVNFGMNDPGNTAAILPSLAAIFGVGLESPLPPMSRSGRDVWGDPLAQSSNPIASAVLGPGTPASWRDDPVNKELEQLGYTPSFPMDTIRGQKLTAQQYDDYVRVAGRMAHIRLEDVVKMPGWSAVPAPSRLKVIKSVITKSREVAATSIMLQSQGTDHDIIRAATNAKLAAVAAPQPAAVQ